VQSKLGDIKPMLSTSGMLCRTHEAKDEMAREALVLLGEG